MFSKPPSLQHIRSMIKADWMLNNHHPQPLETNQQAELTRILARADWDAQEGGRK